MHDYMCRSEMKILNKIGYWILVMIILGMSWTSMASRNSGATMAEELNQSLRVLVVIGLILAVFLYRSDMDK